MMVTLMFLLCLLPFLPPLKMSFSVAGLSVILSVLIYSFSLCVFPMVGLMVSFSSGMMVLFCYCSMFTSYENKTFSTKNYMVLMILVFSVSLLPSDMNSSPHQEVTLMVETPFLLISMGVVLLSMVCINKSMFNPLKSLAISY